MKSLNKAICSKCGLKGDVSVHKNLNKPYVCPHCQFKANTKKTVLFLAGFFICCLLVPKFSEMAHRQRGYKAIGGEVIIPFLYVAAVGFIHTVWRWNSGEDEF